MKLQDIVIKTYVPNKKVVTIIQTRTASKRLPGKVLLEACGKTMLTLMLERVRKSIFTGTIVVATTTEMHDDVIVDICKNENVECFKGHPFDLLDRHYRAAKEFEADIVVKIPSDCPLIDPKIIDRVLGFYCENSESFDYVSNLHPASYPDGNDVEAFSFEALETARNDAVKHYEREHTTPFIWDNPQRFKIGNVKWESGFNLSLSHRWTLDYFEDYLFIKNVFESLYPSNPDFGLDDILELTRKFPEMLLINRKFRGYNWSLNYKDELKTFKQEIL